MKLAALQRRFHAAISAEADHEDRAWKADVQAGIKVYRNAYRARIVGCLRDTYSKTRAWVGDDTFDAAAAHHAILHPPQSWTLDEAGLGFAATLAELFRRDPEVSELAWLEWALQDAFTGPDCPVLEQGAFAEATVGWDEAAWAELTFVFAPTLATARMATDCIGLWAAIEAELAAPGELTLPLPAVVVVWRAGFRPKFRQVSESEALALEQALGGATFGSLCEALSEQLGVEAGAVEAGRMLGWWVGEGLLAAKTLSPCPGARKASI